MSVSVQGLSKHFARGSAPAVEAVDFVAPTGAITTLLGPSGSGKTTVLRMIAGLEIPDRGAVMFDEREATHLPVQKRGVGFVFQGYALFEHMTVRKNVGFGLRMQKADTKAIDARVTELLELVELSDLGERYPHQLSGGQRQRIAFARALATRPKVLLLDEPFGALDARVRVELREWLMRLHLQTHLTTILVTHDQEEALELSQEVVIMHEGRVQQTGSPQAIYDSPANPFVAAFVGNAKMLTGRVDSGIAALGSLSVPAPVGASDGSSVLAFVRPHEVKIARFDGSSAESAVAMIEKLTRVGGFMKVDLVLPSGERIHVQMPKAEVDALEVVPGDRVMVDLGETKIFLGDYSI
jgi:sulfate/thiosulfate transport system ATP-binding protein